MTYIDVDVRTPIEEVRRLMKFINVYERTPKKSGDYEVIYSDGSKGISSWRKGILRRRIKGLPLLSYDYWGDEQYGGKIITHWSDEE